MLVNSRAMPCQPKRLVEFSLDDRVEGVADLWPIQGDDQDAANLLYKNWAVLRVAALFGHVSLLDESRRTMDAVSSHVNGISPLGYP
jgi:hypothetical protein